MNILFCNERFLFRFGVDRALILLGQGLKERGHRIAIMANRFDLPVVEAFADSLIAVPEEAGGYLNLNESTSQWLESNWNQLFDEQFRPDVVVIGGWPFFCSIPVFERFGCRTVFIDCGAVPLDGFDQGARITQEKLRSLRKQYLPKISAATPISRFIATTQTKPEASNCLIEPILLGADHMAAPVWVSSDIELAKRVPLDASLDHIESLRAAGRKVILNLGRWEPGCYKNSEAIFKLVDRLKLEFSQATVLILADPQQIEIPCAYKDDVIPIGFPDDLQLQEIMRRVDLGVSVSLWEGFNLPLAEMQWINKPVLVMNVGAHPEVVLHPWFLCRDIAEMATKALDLLQGLGLNRDVMEEASIRFHQAFQWKSVIDRYDHLLATVTHRNSLVGKIKILVDVTNACRDPANSGVIRVTRRLCRELQAFCEPLFLLWTGIEQGYAFPTKNEYQQLSQYNGPIVSDLIPCSSENTRLTLAETGLANQTNPTWLLLTETVLESNGSHIRDFAKSAGIKVCAVFYDAIPVLRPDFVKDRVIADNHSGYMKGLSNCDLVMPISEFSAKCLASFWSTEGTSGCEVVSNPLPGEFGGAARIVGTIGEPPKHINILCVSTLEPRKNHRRLILSVNQLAQLHPDIDWCLTLIGNRYAGGDDIAAFVENACRENSRIQWLGIVDDDLLHQAYSECAFTIYASEIEGFGMPILESIWHGKPCICHEQGVMSELAGDGGCLTVNVTDVNALANAIARLSTDSALYALLANQARTRPIKDWNTYAKTFINEMVKHSSSGEISRLPAAVGVPHPENCEKVISWMNLLYSGCLTAEWQMNDSERLGLAGVLERLKPSCAIEIGTYRGGSLSLIAQYAETVFSIDIDPSIPEKFGQFENVSFFTGPSQIILPSLLRELNSVGMPVDFVLIDGDHSAAGVKRDIEIMLDYAPQKPLIVLLHDGFNPECRRGMMEADWGKSPYVHYIDLDFIPGRVIEHGGGGDGEMWGGLAMAFFSPITRQGPINPSATSARHFAEMKNQKYA